MALPWASPIKTLVEFRAGRMKFDGRIVTPEAEKGLIQLTNRNGVRSLVWKSRETGITEEHFIVPKEKGQFEYRRLNQCTTGRVYLLEHLPSSKRLFLWLQEPTLQRDFEFYSTLKFYIGDTSPIENEEEYIPGTLSSNTNIMSCPSPSRVSLGLSHKSEEQLEDLIKQFETQPTLSKLESSDGGHDRIQDRAVEGVTFDNWQKDFNENYCQIKAGATEEEIFNVLEKAEDDFNKKRKRSGKQDEGNFQMNSVNVPLLNVEDTKRVSGVNVQLRESCFKKLKSNLEDNLQGSVNSEEIAVMSSQLEYDCLQNSSVKEVYKSKVITTSRQIIRETSAKRKFQMTGANTVAPLEKKFKHC